MPRSSPSRRRSAVIGVVALATMASGVVIGLVAPAAAAACPAPTTLSDGSYLVTITSDCDWTVPTGVTTANILVVGGGGGGGGNGGGGGGGGGVLVETAYAVTPGDSWAATIGAGGAGGSANGSNGSQSKFLRGGAALNAAGGNSGGGNGGSGGSSGTGTNSSNNGGTGSASTYGGGGGGAGGVGANASSAGGAGGNGTTWTVTGTAYGGGGGGGATTGSAGVGTAGGGSGAASGPGTAGTANRGGGGGGGGVSDSGGAGSAGVILVNYAASSPVVTTSTLDDATVGKAYTATLAASGGSGTFTTWAITTGTLPAGLTLAASTGVISGTPTTAGQSTFSVRATDSSGAQTAARSLTLTVLTAAKPTVTTSTLPDGTVGIAYSTTVAASGGSGTYSTWAVTTGTLPAGLSMSATTGAITGTPTTAITKQITVTVTDSAGVTSDPRTLSITVLSPAVPTVTTTSLADAVVGTPYSQTLAASSGSGRYSTWAVKSGALPAGLSLNSSTGVISGTATTPGAFNFGVAVTDSAGSASGTRALTLTVVQAAKPTRTAAPTPTRAPKPTKSASPTRTPSKPARTTAPTRTPNKPSPTKVRQTQEASPTSSPSAKVRLAKATPPKGSEVLTPESVQLQPGGTPGEIVLKGKNGQPLQVLSLKSTSGEVLLATSGADFNKPSTWQAQGYGTVCWKLEPFSSSDYTYTLPDPIQLPAGTPDGPWSYSNVIVKAGSLTSDDPNFQVNTVFANPAPGTAVFADGNKSGVSDPGGRTGDKSISHVIICASGGPAPAPEATGSTSPSGSTPSSSTSPSVTSNGRSFVRNGKVTLCHRTSSQTNPYVSITVDANSVLKEGHGSHTGPVFPEADWGDIIPPFEGFSGLNWPTGQQIYDSGCQDRNRTKVTLCHRTSSQTNPYVSITVDANAVLKEGHGSHLGPVFPDANWGDIIPPFGDYAGLNWPGGRDIYDAGCDISKAAQQAGKPFPGKDPNGKVTLCHRTSSQTNPYVSITVDANAVLKEGHGSHLGPVFPEADWGDIIPPFDGYPGLNWPTGQDIFDAGCDVAKATSGKGKPFPGKDPTGKVTLCHRTSSQTNPYVSITVDANAVLREGHGSHGGPVFPEANWGDIIPPFDAYPGLNWPGGREIYDAGCDVSKAAQRAGKPFPGKDPNGKVTLCHRTSSRTNPYVTITVDANAVLKEGHGSHTGPVFPGADWGDIIPPFDGYPGLNWPAGRDIYDAGCNAAKASAVKGKPFPGADPTGKVTLCHRTSSQTNPYVSISVDANAVLSEGHGSHSGPLFPQPNWGDIIPPFDGYPGLNWPAGQAIFDAGCRIPGLPISSSPSPSSFSLPPTSNPTPNPSFSNPSQTPSPTVTGSPRATQSAPLPTSSNSVPPTVAPPGSATPGPSGTQTPAPSDTGTPAPTGTAVAPTPEPSPTEPTIAPPPPPEPPNPQPRIIIIPPQLPSPEPSQSPGEGSPGTPTSPESTLPSGTLENPSASPSGTRGSGRGGTGQGGTDDPNASGSPSPSNRGKGRYGNATYTPESWARYSSMPGDVTMVVSDGRTMVTIQQPMSVIAAVSDGVAPPPAADELANTGANLAVAITGGIVLMALAIILMPVARRRMS